MFADDRLIAQLMADRALAFRNEAIARDVARSRRQRSRAHRPPERARFDPARRLAFRRV